MEHLAYHPNDGFSSALTMSGWVISALFNNLPTLTTVRKMQMPLLIEQLYLWSHDCFPRWRSGDRLRTSPAARWALPIKGLARARRGALDSVVSRGFPATSRTRVGRGGMRGAR